MANKCEWCGIQDIPMEIHHIRKLKDLKGKMAWEKVMIARKRKNNGSLSRMS
ncbi:HNH endonuclease [Bacillus cereus]